MGGVLLAQVDRMTVPIVFTIPRTILILVLDQPIAETPAEPEPFGLGPAVCLHDIPSHERTHHAITGKAHERVIRTPMRLGINVKPGARQALRRQGVGGPKIHHRLAFTENFLVVVEQTVAQELIRQWKLLAHESHLIIDCKVSIQFTFRQSQAERNARIAVVSLGPVGNQLDARLIARRQIGLGNRRRHFLISRAPGLPHGGGKICFHRQPDHDFVGMFHAGLHGMKPLHPPLAFASASLTFPAAKVTPFALRRRVTEGHRRILMRPEAQRCHLDTTVNYAARLVVSQTRRSVRIAVG